MTITVQQCAFPIHFSFVPRYACLSSPSPPFRRSGFTDEEKEIRTVRTAQYNERRKEENVDCKSRRCWIIGILRSSSFSLSLSLSRAYRVCIWISFALSLSLSHSKNSLCTCLFESHTLLATLSHASSDPTFSHSSIAFSSILLSASLSIDGWIASPAPLVILIDIHLFSYIPWSIVHRPTNGSTIFARFSYACFKKLYMIFYRIYSKSILDILDIYTPFSFDHGTCDLTFI